jgi:hypothetical protein
MESYVANIGTPSSKPATIGVTKYGPNLISIRIFYHNNNYNHNNNNNNNNNTFFHIN